MVDAPAWFQAPMLCKTTQRDLLDDHSKWNGYVAEPKHDGARCLTVARDGDVRLYSRSGQDFTDHVPHLAETLTKWVPDDSVVDGELAILTGDFDINGRKVPITDFNATMRILGSGVDKAQVRASELGLITYVVYDILRWDGVDHSANGQAQRRSTLKKLFPFGEEHLFLNPQFGDPLRFGTLFDTLIDHGVEGIIVKNGGSPYVFDGRPNKTWYKVKSAITMDMIVMGYTEGTGKYDGMIGTVEFGRYTEDGPVYVGRCSGMTDALRRDITNDRDKYLGMVVEVKSNELVGSKEYKTPRHPQFVAFRTDKLPHECLGEELKKV